MPTHAQYLYASYLDEVPAEEGKAELHKLYR